ncbi:L-histidine N(alpha)-methyltransferase [Aquimarina sp. ERC-38]|uniref:L-histidine N(alpha)-methyltransferase n=1 Tax=Aquimarina sp. ERC-38 TaxID=2949996 RepID=UPI002245B88B|nr:L-histidine N(alpha)-methyltransferase [Aquimarina sp. ERC-38]UZO81051.1 L-histidine N(alpha)-methyltransferase [Aquimarina sp. ERC-38]
MNNENQLTEVSTFEKEVSEGLNAFPKYLSSKYFYDEVGDKLFQDIMAMPEYYLTETEYDILKNQVAQICTYFDRNKTGFNLVELGAGDGKKTKVLLRYLLDNQYPITYNPIDISKNAISGLVTNLKEEFSQLEVRGQVGEYFEVLDRLHKKSDQKQVILMLGSNIGNLLHPRAIQFLKKLKNTMHKEDLLFIGFDQKKDPQVILNAYNDTTGITEAFNKNVLVRINKELGGNFNPDHFKHWEVYDPESGTAKSYLVSTKKQSVVIESLSQEISFEAWESIHTEISQKYDDTIVNWLAKESGLEVVTSFTDKKEYYKNYIIKRKN